jgi:hypothetical protein
MMILTYNDDSIVYGILLDSRMSPDLLRGTDKSIGGDLDVDD